ncbi:MAG TPA: hypothetical protein VFW28_13815 [Micropepsaceae bacterium]|nr:hypothetical protein [Micropepsaceae bacterium]
MPITRRASLAGMTGLAGLGALAAFDGGPLAATRASSWTVPAEGIGNRIRHISWSDQGGRPDGVQIMLNRQHLYIGHVFSDGFSVLDASDPRNIKPAKYVLTAPNTATQHLQVANDVLLVAEGANVMAMESYNDARSYFENTLADSITRKVPFRAGLSIFDIKTDPANPREIAFLQMPGFGINRLWWTGGRYAYVAAHFDGFADHILGVVDLQNITKPELISKAWLPGMNRAAKEPNTTPKGKRVALHHMIVAGDRGYGAWRDGGFTVHDIADPRNPKLLSHINWSPPYPGGTHTPLPLPGRKLAIVAEESNAENCEKGLFYTWVVDVREDANPVSIATLPTPKDRDYCTIGNFGPHNLHENRPGSFQSEETIFATYHNAGVRVFDIRDQFAPKEIAFWVPPAPRKLIDTHTGIALAPQTCDVYVRPDGLMYVSDWNAGLHVLQYDG